MKARIVLGWIVVASMALGALGLLVYAYTSTPDQAEVGASPINEPAKSYESWTPPTTPRQERSVNNMGIISQSGQGSESGGFTDTAKDPTVATKKHTKTTSDCNEQPKTVQESILNLHGTWDGGC